MTKMTKMTTRQQMMLFALVHKKKNSLTYEQVFLSC